MRCWWLDYISCLLCCTIFWLTVYPYFSMPREHLHQCHLEKSIKSRGSRIRTILAWRFGAPPHSLAFSYRERQGWLEPRWIPRCLKLPRVCGVPISLPALQCTNKIIWNLDNGRKWTCLHFITLVMRISDFTCQCIKYSKWLFVYYYAEHSRGKGLLVEKSLVIIL